MKKNGKTIKTREIRWMVKMGIIFNKQQRKKLEIKELKIKEIKTKSRTQRKNGKQRRRKIEPKRRC